jgi:hypothetical protein
MWAELPFLENKEAGSRSMRRLPAFLFQCPAKWLDKTG